MCHENPHAEIKGELLQGCRDTDLESCHGTSFSPSLKGVVAVVDLGDDIDSWSYVNGEFALVDGSLPES